MRFLRNVLQMFCPSSAHVPLMSRRCSACCFRHVSIFVMRLSNFRHGFCACQCSAWFPCSAICRSSSINVLWGFHMASEPPAFSPMFRPCSARLFCPCSVHILSISRGGATSDVVKKLSTLLDLCVSSLRRGHANMICIVAILTDDPQGNPNTLGSGAPKGLWENTCYLPLSRTLFLSISRSHSTMRPQEPTKNPQQTRKEPTKNPQEPTTRL